MDAPEYSPSFSRVCWWVCDARVFDALPSDAERGVMDARGRVFVLPLSNRIRLNRSLTLLRFISFHCGSAFQPLATFRHYAILQVHDPVGLASEIEIMRRD